MNILGFCFEVLVGLYNYDIYCIRTTLLEISIINGILSVFSDSEHDNMIIINMQSSNLKANRITKETANYYVDN